MLGVDEEFTRVIARAVDVGRAVVRDPGYDRDEIRDEARDLALHDSRVTADHVLVLGFSHIVLSHNCKKKTSEM